jgi:hypothetical protein
MPKNLQQIWPRSNTYVEAGNGPVLGDNEVESVADGYFKIASALRGYDIDPVD